MSQLQDVRDRIPERPDSKLERASVANEDADVERDQIVHGADGGIGRREERKIVLGRIDERVKEVVRNGGITVHEREISIHLGE
jgi:hypothetical protein